MPQVKITQPFNFRHGVEVKQYKPGEQEVSAEVAAHAEANGFTEKAPSKPEPAKAIEKQ